MNLTKTINLNKEQIIQLFELTKELKKEPLKFKHSLVGKNVFFGTEKSSLRTRISFEVAMNHLGGNCIYYNLKDSTIGKKESWKDAIKNLERYVDLIALRVFSHNIFNEVVNNTKIPIINALSDDYHPLQILADLFTIKEKLGHLSKINIAYVGDANNNVTHSLILACAMFEINLKIGCPKELIPKSQVLIEAKKIGNNPIITTDPFVAVKDAQIVITDSWKSYDVTKDNTKILQKFQVNSNLMKHTNNALFMHCLPAHRGKEVTNEVIDSVNSIVYDEAENRLHTQKALILMMLK